MMKTGTDRQKLKVFFTEYLLPYKWALAGLLALILLGVAMGSSVFCGQFVKHFPVADRHRFAALTRDLRRNALRNP